MFEKGPGTISTNPVNTDGAQGPSEAIYAQVINDGWPGAVFDGSGSGGHGDCHLMAFDRLNYVLLR